MKRQMIFAADLAWAIGQNSNPNGLPWESISEDFKNFQLITKACGRVLMGGKTWRAIFKKLGKALPGRENIVISKIMNEPPYPGVLVFNSFEAAMEYLQDKDVICIGGAQIYQQFVPYATELFFTQVHAIYDKADCFIDKVLFEGFTEIPTEMLVFREDTPDQIKVTAHYYKKTA